MKYDLAKNQNTGLNSRLAAIGKREKAQIEAEAKMRNQRLRAEERVKTKQDALKKRHETAILEKMAELTNGDIGEEEMIK